MAISDSDKKQIKEEIKNEMNNERVEKKKSMRSTGDPVCTLMQE